MSQALRPAARRADPSRLFPGRPLGGRIDDFPAAPPALMSSRGFELAVEHCLELLEGAHVAVTLFAVGWRSSSPPPPLVERVVADALTPLGSVGRLPDGRIALLYLGPRGDGGRTAAGTDALRSYVLNRILHRLTEKGWSVSAAALELTATHVWTDQGVSAAALLRRLTSLSPSPAADGDYSARGNAAVT